MVESLFFFNLLDFQRFISFHLTENKPFNKSVRKKCRICS